MVPSRTKRPRLMMIALSQICSTSERMCELRKIVFPSAFSEKIRSRTSLRPAGSNPEVGSSMISNCGSPSIACAMPNRCTIPREYFPIFSFSYPVNFTLLNKSVIRASISPSGTLANAA